MDPQDLLNLTALLAAGRQSPDPPPQDQASMLADAPAEYGTVQPLDPQAVNQPGDGASVRPTLLAAAVRPGFWDHWSVPSCQNCHGYTPSTLPPVGGHFPFGISPRSGGSGGSGGDGSRPPRERYPQCDVQGDLDAKICGRQPTPRDKAICHESAFDRRVYCQRTGEVGFPDLKTARGR